LLILILLAVMNLLLLWIAVLGATGTSVSAAIHGYLLVALRACA